MRFNSSIRIASRFRLCDRHKGGDTEEKEKEKEKSLREREKEKELKKGREEALVL